MSSTDSMRVMIVTPSLPYPLIWGFGIRVYQIIKYLAERHHVTVLAYAGPQDAANVAALRETGATICPVVRDEPSTAAKRRAQLSSLLSPRSFQRQSLESPAMQAAIDRTLATDRFDVIQVESSQMSGFNYGPDTPLIVDEHNIEYELLYRTFKTERSPLRKLFNWVEYRKFRRDEQRSWKMADGCIVTSDREAIIMREHAPKSPSIVVPNGVDVEYFQPSSVTPDPNSIVFVGVMHYRPNVDAAVYFIRDILPHLQRERPELKFTIIGAEPADELQRLASPHVILTGKVPDTRPFVARAGAIVVPLRMGSGTRLKVLEGLAMGRPLVSTSLGAEGIEAVDGQHLLLADEPRAFAHAVSRVLDDHALSRNLGRDGRALVAARYSWTSVLSHLEAFMHARRRAVVRPPRIPAGSR
jgi:sugar transferase (PEP-CTERM/EpsH1 system associated)